MRDLAAQTRFAGAQVGILATLHTWTGPMHHHPHVHMLATGGGVSDGGTGWHDAPNRFLVPVKKLSPMIAERFAKALRQDHPELFAQVPASAWKREWCSYCKPCGTGQDAVLRYLARYIFRIALSDMEAHAYVVKCPKCGSLNLRLLEKLRRRSTAMLS